MLINNTYSFVTLAPSILGNRYESMKVKAIMTVTEAVKHMDVYTVHSTIKDIVDSIPSIETCTFILFSNTDGKDILLANEWIDQSSIKVVSKVNATFTLKDIDTKDISIIKNKLLELGYNNIDISTF